MNRRLRSQKIGYRTKVDAPSVERYRARSLRARLMPWAYIAVLVATAGLVIAVGVSWVGAAHRARVAEQRACQAELTAMQTATPMLRSMVRPADPCVALRVVVRERQQ